MKALEALKKAYNAEIVQIVIDLPEGIKAVLNYADAVNIFGDQDRHKDLKLAEYTRKGYHKDSINEKKWNRSLEQVKPEQRARLEKDKPDNLAEQMADDEAKRMVLFELVPKYLTDEKGILLFPTEDEQREFGRLLLNVPALMTQFVSKITELYEKIEEVGKIKNSSKTGN